MLCAGLVLRLELAHLASDLHALCDDDLDGLTSNWHLESMRWAHLCEFMVEIIRLEVGTHDMIVLATAHSLSLLLYCTRTPRANSGTNTEAEREQLSSAQHSRTSCTLFSFISFPRSTCVCVCCSMQA